jgi:hypothetical protein
MSAEFLTVQKMIKITKYNYAGIKFDMHQFLNTEINRYIEIAGSPEKLSRALGNVDLYIRVNIGRLKKRQSFSALERIYKKCVEVYG